MTAAKSKNNWKQAAFAFAALLSVLSPSCFHVEGFVTPSNSNSNGGRSVTASASSSSSSLLMADVAAVDEKVNGAATFDSDKLRYVETNKLSQKMIVNVGNTIVVVVGYCVEIRFVQDRTGKDTARG